MLFSRKKTLPLWRKDVSNPAIGCRVMHIDLKGPKIPFEVFADFLETLGRWGINGVLVEYEHRLPQLPVQTQFPKVDRYSRDEIRELTELADKLGIEWIPLVQTFGHVEYLSRLSGSTDMFENPDYPCQLCPSSEKVRTYLKNLIEIVCQMHPRSRRIHVGQDETFHLGFCPACRKRMKKIGGKIEFYLEHARWVWSLVLDRGRQPMFWGDMLLGEGRLDLIKKIPADVIVLPWDYGSTGPVTAEFVLWKGQRPSKQVFRHPYSVPVTGEMLPVFAAPGSFAEDLDAPDIETIGGFDLSKGYPRSFSQIRAMAKTGRHLWGTCGVYTSSDMHFRPDFVRGTLNPAHMCQTLADLGGQGVIGTSWARGHSLAPIGAPWPVTLYNVAQFAASSWTGSASVQDIKARRSAIARELDMPEKIGEWSLDDLLRVVSCRSQVVGNSGKIATVDRVLKLLRKSDISGCFGDGLLISLEAELLALKYDFLCEEVLWWRPNRENLPPSIVKQLRARFSEIHRDAEVLKKRAQPYYVTWVGEKAAFETWWIGAVGVHEQLAESAISSLLSRRKSI